MKSTFLSTEFILTVLLLVGAYGAFFLGKITWPEATTAVAVALAVGLYANGRSTVKAAEAGSDLAASAEALAVAKSKEVKP